MPSRAFQCPQCGGSLSPDRFGRPPKCPFCGSTLAPEEPVIAAERFREAFRAWDAPESHGFGATLSLGEGRWAPGTLLARGEIADVYLAERARWPGETGVLKILRDRSRGPRFENEHARLRALQESPASGAAQFARRVPRVAAFGTCGQGLFEGAPAMLLRWNHGFRRTFEEVRRAFPAGIEPRAALWVWRRTLETLTFLHTSGLCHGAVLPEHLLVQDGEHGVLLVGYGLAGPTGDPLRGVSPDREGAYPAQALSSGRLSHALDIALSARAVAFLLGGTPAGELPGAVPERLAALLRRLGWEGVPVTPSFSAWKLREDLGALAAELFGAPVFCPIPDRA